MARNEDRKAELIRELARARRQLDLSGRSVRHALDVPARVRRNFKKNAFAWVGGALLVGVLIAKLPRRSRNAPADTAKNDALPKAGAAGLLLAGGKMAFDLLRPILIKWLVQRATPYAEDMAARFTARYRDSRD